MKRYLFVIDMQNDFIDGSLGTSEAVKIVPACAEKIKHFSGNKIIATLDTHFSETYENSLEGKKLPVVHCVDGTRGHGLNEQIKAALLARKDVEVETVKKYTFGAADVVNRLKQELSDETEPPEFEIAGLCTDICVISNALLLRAAFPDSVITADATCCAGVTPRLHEAALAAMRSCQIDVVNDNRDSGETGFDAEAIRDGAVEWIREWFAENGPGSPAVIGISGGKDSTVVAALCARALGPECVVGVMMPDGVQPDIDDSKKVVSSLGIRGYTVNIAAATRGVTEAIGTAGLCGAEPLTLSEQTRKNLPPRIRMATIYAVSQSMNGRVANTCNLSETMIGWETKWGDAVGDFSPLCGLTASEVVKIGLTMPEIPEELAVKAPSDGLCGRTDEDAFGFRYSELDRYIRTGEAEPGVKEKIDAKIRGSAFKRAPIQGFDAGLPKMV